MAHEELPTLVKRREPLFLPETPEPTGIRMDRLSLR